MQESTATDPRVEYASRLTARRLAAARLGRFDLALSAVRGFLALAAVVLAWLAFGRHALSGASLLLPAGAFLLIVVLHDRLATRQTRAGRAITLYQRALARLDGNWARPDAEDGRRFLDPNHPFAADLDLFGPSSLFQLLCTARSAGGEAMLAGWLLNPAPSDVLGARQAAVDELRPRLDLREALWIAGADVRAGVDPEKLTAWGESPPLLPWRWLRPALLAASLVMAAIVGAWATGRLPGSAAGLAAAVVVTISMVLRERTAAVTDHIGRPEAHLALLASLIGVFEAELANGPPVTSATVRALHERLTVDGVSASRQIARLGRLARLLAWERNTMFAPVAYALLWRPQCTAAIEAWRRKNGPRIAAWLATLSELEALCCLATHAYDHPERPFPTLSEPAQGPTFHAVAVAHPLLAQCVPNDVRLGGTASDPRLIMLSGSNMSGKSTLMRTVGVNAVLALAGAPVRATSLRLSLLALGATLRIQDSLLAGTSRFYAEVSRLRQLVDLARGPVPALFLIDEILAGTNSHDRRLGAAAVLRGLVEKGAIGIASTHDLALTAIADELGNKASNQHFEDHLVGDKLHFDYQLRTGVVQRSNALALMRAVGLDV